MPTLNIKDITESKMVRLVDLSEDSINNIAEAVVRKIAVDAEPVRHGHWKKTITWWIYCSVCGSEPPSECNIPTPYCPWCGAKMDENEWEESGINPCRGCVDYDGRGGCKSNGGCGTTMNGVET